PPMRGALPTYAKWIQQALDAAVRASTPYWALVIRRDRRMPLLLIPLALWDLLEPKVKLIRPDATLTTDWVSQSLDITVLGFFGFLSAVDPTLISWLARKVKRA